MPRQIRGGFFFFCLLMRPSLRPPGRFPGKPPSGLALYLSRLPLALTTRLWEFTQTRLPGCPWPQMALGSKFGSMAACYWLLCERTKKKEFIDGMDGACVCLRERGRVGRGGWGQTAHTNTPLKQQQHCLMWPFMISHPFVKVPSDKAANEAVSL